MLTTLKYPAPTFIPGAAVCQNRGVRDQQYSRHHQERSRHWVVFASASAFACCFQRRTLECLPRRPLYHRRPSACYIVRAASVEEPEVSAQVEEAADYADDDGDSCMIPDWDDATLLASQKPAVPKDTKRFYRDLVSSLIFYVLPFLGPAFAFSQWKTILGLVHSVIGDEAKLLELTQVTLTPATNGVVVASCAIALGTLTSVTVSSLRQRQLVVRSCLNKEACEIAMLTSAINAMLGPPLNQAGVKKTKSSEWNPVMHLQALQLLREYCARVLVESSLLADASKLQEQCISETELMGILDAFRASEGMRAYTVCTLRDEATVRIAKLNDARSERLAYISTGFPFFHWVILALLAGSIALCFLIEVDQSEGRFLQERPGDSIRLRIVFTLMGGAFSGLAALCADLNDPFRGSFNINSSTQQFARMVQVLGVEIDQIRSTKKRCRP